MQLLLTGVPILFIARDSPQKYAVVFSILLLVGSVAILASLFVLSPSEGAENSDQEHNKSKVEAAP